MIVPDLVVEVYARAAGDWSCGSGYGIGGGLVVTSAHVVTADGRPSDVVEVRWLHVQERISARVVWSGFGGGVDVALLAVDAEPALPGGVSVVRWGRLVGVTAGVACAAVGFPDVVANPTMRDSLHLAGTINPRGLVKAGLHSIDVAGPPRRPAGGTPWAGMSGAAVFCAGLLVAVVARDAAGFASGRLTAVPIAACMRDPAFAAAVEQATGGPVWLEPVELIGLLAGQVGVDSPASLLRADVAAVRFRGRERLVDDLRRWCEQDERLGVRLLVGPGGQGKTRLGEELAGQVRRTGWVAGRVVEGAPDAAVAALSGLAADALLIVDYAESRAGQVRQLIERARAAAVRVRLLLLARTAGDWVNELAAQAVSTELVAMAPVDHLGPVDTEPAGRIESWRGAVDDLAVRLPAVPGYADTLWPTVADTVRTAVPASLTAAPAVTVLAVQMAALARLLLAGQPVPDNTPVESVLLLHEERYWSRTAEVRALGLSRVTRQRAVAAATIWSASDEPEGARLVAGLPGLADLDGDRRTAAAHWLAGLYPSQGRFWGSLQPD
ncbi:MAG TPA: hypothetical protein VFB84_00085, partial [Micromonosporaceae bacterium]|nr:hypothetical protein [Micromonosporaceae bacterium]